MAADHVLDLVGEHIEAGDDDHVLLAIDDAHEVILLDDRDIAGADEALVIHRLTRGIVTLPVALHHLGAAHAQLARRIAPQRHAIGVHHLELGARHRLADGTQLQLARRIEADDGRGLGHAVALGDRAAGDGFPAFGRAARQRHAAGDGQLETREVQRLEVITLTQRREQRVEADEGGERCPGQCLDEAIDIARIGDQHAVVAAFHAVEAIHREGIDVIDRQRRDQHLLTFIEHITDHAARLQHVGDQIAVGQHGALGDAGGTAGVLQRGDVLGLARDTRVREPRPALEHVTQAVCVGQVVLRHHLLDVAHRQVDQRTLGEVMQVTDLGDDDLLDGRALEHLLELVRHVGQNHDGASAGVMELVLHLALGVERVGVDHHQAGAQRAEYRHRELQQVRQLDGDAVTGLKAGLVFQPGGEIARQAVHIGVAERLAHAAEGRTVGIVGAAGLEDLENRGVILETGQRLTTDDQVGVPGHGASVIRRLVGFRVCRGVGRIGIMHGLGSMTAFVCWIVAGRGVFHWQPQARIQHLLLSGRHAHM